MAALLSEPAAGVVPADERRIEVVRRLMAEGVPVRALEALFPGWEFAIYAVLEERDAV